MNIGEILTYANDSIKIYDLNDEQLKLLAEQDVKFKQLDIQTALAPQKIYLIRVGHNIQIGFCEDNENEEDIVIEDYYVFPDY